MGTESKAQNFIGLADIASKLTQLSGNPWVIRVGHFRIPNHLASQHDRKRISKTKVLGKHNQRTHFSLTPSISKEMEPLEYPLFMDEIRKNLLLITGAAPERFAQGSNAFEAPLTPSKLALAIESIQLDL